MKMARIKGIAGALLEMERRADVAQGRREGRPRCLGCSWSSDDPELDLCCDCTNDEFMRQMLRGDYGAIEQREARESCGGTLT